MSMYSFDKEVTEDDVTIPVVLPILTTRPGRYVSRVVSTMVALGLIGMIRDKKGLDVNDIPAARR